VCPKGDADSLRSEAKLWIHQLPTELCLNPSLLRRVMAMLAGASDELALQVMVVMVVD